MLTGSFVLNCLPVSPIHLVHIGCPSLTALCGIHSYLLTFTAMTVLDAVGTERADAVAVALVARCAAGICVVVLGACWGTVALLHVRVMLLAQSSLSSPTCCL
jgi:hypothetical protein